MTFLGLPRKNEEIDSSESLATSDRREAEFESDADHKEMTRTYGSDDYLSRWLPNIKQVDNLGLLREKAEKRAEKERPIRIIFKSPCRHHEGRKLTPRDNKTPQDPTRKTYFEAIKCSPMKLRQSLANFKRSKLDETFSLKPNHDAIKNPNNPNVEAHRTDLLTPTDSMENLTEKTVLETKISKPSVVEMHNDEMGQLGSLCFRRSLPENKYSESLYAPCHMVGGKLRKVYKAENVLLTGRNKHKELLVRCESIMIYPKVLINQKSDKYRIATKPTPKEAWNDASHSSLSLASKNSENFTRLPTLPKEQTTEQRNESSINTNLLAEIPQQMGQPSIEFQTTQQRQASTAIRNSAPTTIIIPFGENKNTSPKASPGQNRQVPTPKTSIKEDVVEAFEKIAGESNLAEKGMPLPAKGKCLKESSKLNEQPNSTRRHSNIILGVKHIEMNRKQPISTQYLTVTTSNSQTKKFRIPTGENNELLLGRENCPPKRNVPYRFSYSQRGFAEFNKGFDQVTTRRRDSDGYKQKVTLKIGGKGLLKGSATDELVSETLVEDENKKRVQFLLQKSRYFT